MSAERSSLFDGPVDSPVHILLAHGAGAGLDHDFMSGMANRLATHGFHIIRFNFPYMDRIRQEGKKRPPDRMPVLEACFTDMIAAVPTDKKLVIAGKSMGGRVASMMAAKDNQPRPVDAWCALGYPFHAPGKPDKLRMDHFPDISCPGLICQGDRDPFGTEAEITALDLGSRIDTVYLPDGEHSFKPRKASGHNLEANMDMAAAAMKALIARITTGK